MKTNILLKTLLIVCSFLAVAITTHAQNLYVSINGDFSNTGGSVFEYTPAGMQTTFATGLAEPRGLAFDSSGNLFVGTTTRNPAGNVHARILEFPLQGHSTVLGNAALSFAQGVATDGAGNVFVMAQDLKSPTLAGIIYKFAPDGSPTVFRTTPGQSFLCGRDPRGAGRRYSGVHHRRCGNRFCLWDRSPGIPHLWPRPITAMLIVSTNFQPAP